MFANGGGRSSPTVTASGNASGGATPGGRAGPLLPIPGDSGRVCPLLPYTVSSGRAESLPPHLAKLFRKQSFLISGVAELPSSSPRHRQRCPFLEAPRLLQEGPRLRKIRPKMPRRTFKTALRPSETGLPRSGSCPNILPRASRGPLQDGLQNPTRRFLLSQPFQAPYGD